MFIFGVHKKSYFKFYQPILVSLILILSTLILGIWQLQRLEWKNSLIKSFENLQTIEAVYIEDTEIKEFIKITAKGNIDRSKKIFLPAKTNMGQVGVRIASVFTLENGSEYLIDEGWFNNNKYDYFKYNDEIIEETIEGYIRFPRDAKFFTPENNENLNEWYTYDLLQISKYLSSTINQNFFIRKTNPNKDSNLISSTYKHQFRNNHLQYAITWFCMSFAFIIMFLVYLKKNNK